jgi:hypothetical protein
VALTHLPAEELPIYLGMVGPKASASGRIADGSVLSVLAGVDYVRWARADRRGRRGRSSEPHRVVTYVLYSVDVDGAVARKAVRRRRAST